MVSLSKRLYVGRKRILNSIPTSSDVESCGNAKLFYLVGPSGAGKDSIIDGLRRQMNGDTQLLIAHRYITRGINSSENHIELSEKEFIQRQEGGLFALSWQANDCFYAVGSEVNHWLSQGFSVLFNGSRQHIPQAKSLFGQHLRVVALDVDPEILTKRLHLRGRESSEKIQQRLQRSLQYQASLPDDCWLLDNNNDLATSINKLHHYISTQNDMNPDLKRKDSNETAPIKYR